MAVVDVADNRMNMVLLEELLVHLVGREVRVEAFGHLPVYTLDILAMKDIGRLDDNHAEAEDNFLVHLGLVHMVVALVVGLCKFESLGVAGTGRCSMLVVEHCSVVYMEFVVVVVDPLVVEDQMVAMNMVTAKLEELQLLVVVVVVGHLLFRLVHLWLVELELH